LIGVEVRVRDKGQLKTMGKKVGENLPASLGDSCYAFARLVANKLQIGAVNDSKRPITADRANAAAKIRAVRKSRIHSQVTMPGSLVALDSEPPGFVTIRRNYKIGRWAKKYYGTAKVAGKSTVWRGPRGGLNGSIYVTPHPFISRALMSARNTLPNELRRGVRRAFKT
jgi:hypothetical protein